MLSVDVSLNTGPVYNNESLIGNKELFLMVRYLLELVLMQEFCKDLY